MSQPASQPASQPGSPPGAEASRHRFLLVRAGEERCLLALGRVRQVVRDLAVHPLPGADEALAGLAELGGEPLPILDLTRVVAAAPGASPDRPVTVVAWAGPDDDREMVGLQVDAALEVVAVDPADIVPTDGGVVRGDVTVGDVPARVLSLAALGSVGP